MYILTRFLLVLFVVLGMSKAYSMRCGNDIVSTGDSYSYMISKCGNPVSSNEDFFRDRGYYIYKLDGGAVYTVVTLKNVITDINMGR